MRSLGEILISERKRKKISLQKASFDLHIKKQILENIENHNWESLPEAPFLKGLIQNYAEYLSLDPNHTLAIFRREYDEASLSSKKTRFSPHKPSFLTPTRFINFIFALLIVSFVIYLVLQYFSILAAPKLEIYTPDEDSTSTVPVIQVTGKTEEDSTVSIDGELVPVDQGGSFSREVKLKEGKNEIVVIASKKLSPKSKVIRIVRLIS